jgi:exopolyphosphatase/guanosine-5'-triphosphate,3'-diphosphate pyrophosphatase
MNIAIIDLGTNTFHLLIVEVNDDGNFNKLYKTKTNVKLGRGTIVNNVISTVPFTKGLLALEGYQETIEEYDVKQVFAFATSAIRSAINGVDFIKKVKEKTGIEIKVITGEEEAELICYGVREALDIGDKKALVMDIGGGSVEFIVADKIDIFWKKSYNIGVARLLEKFHPSDPITPIEINRIEQYLKQELKQMFTDVGAYAPKTLIGSSGSFDTFADMINYKLEGEEISKIASEYTFDMDLFAHINEQLLKSTNAERKHTKGIIPMRVDMIVPATILVSLVIKKLNITEMRLSNYALKEGVLAQIMKGNLKGN